MPLHKIPKKIKNLQRSRQIAKVLIKHGFGHFVERIGLSIPFSPQPEKKAGEPIEVSARLVLEELGPTFIKFGQILSMRPDLLPKKFIDEFKKLQDNVPKFSYEEVEAQIKKELGSPINELYDSFDKDPIAAASISQVHHAILNGEDVVVKVQRPNIEDEIEADIDILYNLAHLMQKHITETAIYDPVGVVGELAKSIRRELDFMVEARNADRFKKNFASDPSVYIPTVYWEHTSKRVLTMEMVRGTKISNLGPDIDEEGRKLLAEKIAKTYLKQILVDGFFHGDPHPGNIFIVDREVIALIDFGITGRVDEYMKEKLCNLLIAILQKNKDKIVDELLDIGVAGEETSIAEFRLDISDLIEEYYGTSIQQVDVARMINEVLQIALKHKIKIPANFTLLIKTLVNLEGLCSELSKEFNFTETAKPFVENIAAQQISPTRVASRLAANLMELNEIITVIPRKINYILSKLQEGKLVIDLEHKGLNRLISEMDTVSNRISMSLIISAIIVSSSILVISDKGPHISDLPIIGIIGYLVAAFIGFLLVLSILRRGKF